MPEMYTKCRNGVPYRYMYGEEDAAAALFFGDGYKTPEEAKAAYERDQREKRGENNG